MRVVVMFEEKKDKSGTLTINGQRIRCPTPEAAENKLKGLRRYYGETNVEVVRKEHD